MTTKATRLGGFFRGHIAGAHDDFALLQRDRLGRHGLAGRSAQLRGAFRVDRAVGADQQLHQRNRHLGGRLGQGIADHNGHAAHDQRQVALADFVAHDSIQRQRHFAHHGLPLFGLQRQDADRHFGAEFKLGNRQQTAGLFRQGERQVIAHGADGGEHFMALVDLLAAHGRFLRVVLFGHGLRGALLRALAQHGAFKGDAARRHHVEAGDLAGLEQQAIAVGGFPGQHHDQQEGDGGQHCPQQGVMTPGRRP